MRRRASILLVAAILCVPPSAHAAEPAATKEHKREAKRLFQAAKVDYDLQNYDAAIEEYLASYRAFAFPETLFNLAQAYRMKNDYKNAIHYYETYLLELPDAPNRESVEARLQELRELEKAQRASQAQPPQGVVDQQLGSDEAGAEPTGAANLQATAPSPAPAPPTPAPALIKPTARSQGAATAERARTTSPWRTWGWVATAAGLGAIGVGSGFLWAAEDKRAEAAGQREFQAKQILEEADHRERIGWITAASGGAIAVGGLLMLVYGPREAQQVTVTAGVGSISVAVNVTFRAF